MKFSDRLEAAINGVMHALPVFLRPVVLPLLRELVAAIVHEKKEA